MMIHGELPIYVVHLIFAFNRSMFIECKLFCKKTWPIECSKIKIYKIDLKIKTML